MGNEECMHETIWFGSGDYYIFCECGASWVFRNPVNEQPAPELANKGKRALLSGERRVKK